ncbi:MAG: hypothetical protein RXO32_10380 [Thermoproteus sp.]
MSRVLNVAEPAYPPVNATQSGIQKYEVVSTSEQAPSNPLVQQVRVKALDGLLIIRRGTGTPKEAVSGRADVVVGIDEWGRVVNVEIEFAEYYFQDAETAREILRKARW